MNHFELLKSIFVLVYGFKCGNNMNEVIRKMFEKRSKPKSAERPVDCLKSLDPNKFPTCRALLKQHIKRAWFTTKLYKTAYMAYPLSDCTPIDYGQKLSECGNYLEINWFEDYQVLPEIKSLEETNINNEQMFDEYYEDSDGNIYENDESDKDDGSDYDHV